MKVSHVYLKLQKKELHIIYAKGAGGVSDNKKLTLAFKK